MKILANHIIWIVSAILLSGCYGISKPDDVDQTPMTNALGAEVSILEKEMGVIGSTSEKLTPKKMSIDTDIANWRYDVSYSAPKKHIEGIEINFHFKSDSICQSKYNELKSWMDANWGEANCPESFCTWEVPSSRNFTATVMLSDMSNFFKSSTLKINLLENDGRVYRK